MTSKEANSSVSGAAAPARQFSAGAKTRLIGFSLLGFFCYFISFTIADFSKNTIVVDHIGNIIKYLLGNTLTAWVCIVAMVAGAIQPFVNKTWKKSTTSLVFTAFKIAGVPVGLIYMLNKFYGIQVGPESIYTPGSCPFCSKSWP